ncbi:3,4-dihydroxy-2-butanone-4-phosphate synthase [Bacteroides sp. 224]|uniref:3,4-dihydroxy-2-butanone-4-phosphate synthase n=1 Tax=Bacteroides sp. 224 TaxID=2302936 RepID=UPI0013D778EA|nr:3,4-dihydroxy-2-butanone-4-phosphate synthase [Bacteroides sp. 224]NDV64732.1 3,4-dihydroxy-2-butanone-4-phosphate synthase [Bacteroides sp. 224]
MKFTLNSIEESLEELRQGKILIVVDDEDRENEGDFIVAGEKITPEIVNFMLTYGRGIMCVPLTEARCQELQLDMMACDNTSLLGTPFTMSVDLIGYGCTTGVSAHDRAATIQALMNPQTRPEELARPGHIFPLRAANNGVFDRDGHTEALIDLTRLAGLTPGGALIEILNPDGSMARLPELVQIAKEHELKICSIADLIEYRKERGV